MTEMNRWALNNRSKLLLKCAACLLVPAPARSLTAALLPDSRTWAWLPRAHMPWKCPSEAVLTSQQFLDSYLRASSQLFQFMCSFLIYCLLMDNNLLLNHSNRHFIATLQIFILELSWVIMGHPGVILVILESFWVILGHPGVTLEIIQVCGQTDKHISL